MAEAQTNGARESTGRTQSGMQNAQTTILKSGIEQRAKDVGERALTLSRIATDVYHQASDVVSDKVHQLQRQGKEVIKVAESSLTKKPFVAMSVVMGTGVLCGLGIASLFRKGKHV